METPPTNACHRWHIYSLGSTRAINSSIRALLFTLCGRRIEPPPSPLLTPPPAVVSRATIGLRKSQPLQFRVFNKSVLKGKKVLRHHVNLAVLRAHSPLVRPPLFIQACTTHAVWFARLSRSSCARRPTFRRLRSMRDRERRTPRAYSILLQCHSSAERDLTKDTPVSLLPSLPPTPSSPPLPFLSSPEHWWKGFELTHGKERP